VDHAGVTPGRAIASKPPMNTLSAPRRIVPGLSIVVLAVALGGCSILSPAATESPAPSLGATSTPTIEPGPTLAPSPTPSPTPAPTATPVAAILLCSPSGLAARITLWSGGAGHRDANVELTNNAATTCEIRKLEQPQLIDGHGSVLINGAAPASSTFITMTPGSVLKTTVDDSNYCGSNPVAPVSVAFIYPGGAGRFVATPLSPTDLSGVPPCLGAGSPALVSMLPWGP
jgi:hypothetical protein